MNALGEAGPNATLIRPVVDTASPYLPVVVEVFRRTFPEYEHYLPYLRRSVVQDPPPRPTTVDHVWLVEQRGDPVGVRLFSYLHGRNLGFDAFIGLLEPYRGQGIGAWLVRQTMAQLCVDARSFGNGEPLGYVAEVEPVEGAEDERDRRLRQRRLCFHRRAGGLVLDVEYLEAQTTEGVILDHLDPKPMHLLFYPAHQGRELNESQLADVLEGLYLDVYRLSPDSEYLRRALNSIRTRGDQ